MWPWAGGLISLSFSFSALKMALWEPLCASLVWELEVNLGG